MVARVAFRSALSYNRGMARPTDILRVAWRSLGLIAGALLLGACATADFDRATTSAALRADANGDRNVSCEEWRNWLAATYKTNDADGSGALSGAEYEQFVVDTGLFQAIPLTRIDTNADERYSQEEITLAGAEVFETGDRNNDCVLSRRELGVSGPDTPPRSVEETTKVPPPDTDGACLPPLCREPVDAFPSKKEN